MRTHGWAGSTPADDAEAVERIVRGAGELIEAGQVVNVHRLAGHLGVTRQTLYRYFPDTAAIVRAVAASATTDFLTGLSTALEGITDPADAVVEGIAVTVESLRSNRRFALLFDSTESSRPIDAVTSEGAIDMGRAVLESVDVEWHEAGWTDLELDELVEFMLRMLQSLIIDPGDPARTGESLRAFLRRWVAPALGFPS